MSGFMKVLAALAVLFILAVGAMMALSGIAAKAGKATAAEAEQFASHTDEQGCLDEAVRRVRGCDGVICSAKVAMFEVGCFTEAKQTVGFCDGVPSIKSEDRKEKWMAERCPELGLEDEEQCALVVSVRQAYCDSDDRPPEPPRESAGAVEPAVAEDASGAQSSETVNSTASGSSMSSTGAVEPTPAPASGSAAGGTVVPSRD